MNDLFLSIEYNEREFEKIDEFKSALNGHYNYQIRPKWIPAAAEGGEFWMTIFINSKLSEFIAAAITGGLLWDVIKVAGKRYILKPLTEALEILNQNNSQFGGLRVRRLKFQFDNCQIIIGGLNQNFTSVISFIFSQIAKMKPRFESDNEGQEVIKIELPIDYNPSVDKRGYSPYQVDVFNEDYDLKAFKKMWKITFSTNYPVLVYDFSKNTYFDAYPNK